MKGNEELYFEVEKIDIDNILLSLALYPLIVTVGIVVFFANFIRLNLKLLTYLIISVIPILNLLIVIEEKDIFSLYDNFKIDFKENFIITKRIKIKNEKTNSTRKIRKI